MLHSNSFAKRRLGNFKCQLTDKEQELKELISTKSKYLKNINYEEETSPLVGITGIAQGLINHWENLSPSQLKEYMLAIARSSDRILTLMNNVFDLARLNSENFNLNKSPVNLSQMLKQKFENFQFTDENKLGQIKFISNPTEDLFVKCDKYLINRLLDNLISSIIAFTTINYIKVSLGKAATIISSGHVEIIINFKRNEVESICFDRVSKNKTSLNNSATKSLKFNENAALALASKIVDLHEGKIRLETCDHETRNIILTLLIN